MAKKSFPNRGTRKSGKKKLDFKQTQTSAEQVYKGFGDKSAAPHMRKLVYDIMSEHGKQTERDIRTTLSRQFSPRQSWKRPFPTRRTGRLQASIGHSLRKSDASVSLATGILRRVPLENKKDLPPQIYARFLEYGRLVRMKNPRRPFFYIPIPGSPAMSNDGVMDRKWLPGPALINKLKVIGRRVGARAFYFPSPVSLSARTRMIFITARRWNKSKGADDIVIQPTPIAVGVREFRIQERPYLRPAWHRLWNEKGTGEVNKTLAMGADELAFVLKGGLKNNPLAHFESLVVQFNIELEI